MSIHPLLAMTPGSRRRRRPHGLTADDFSPAAVAGLLLWWEADSVFTDPSFTTASTDGGSNVGVFYDKSENGNHGLLVGGGDGAEVQDDPGYLGVSARIVNESYAATNVSGLENKTAFTVMLVRRVYSVGTGTYGETQWFRISNSSNNNIAYMSKDTSTARIISGTIGGASGYSRFGATPVSPSLIVEVLVFDGSQAPSERLIYKFGGVRRYPLTGAENVVDCPFSAVDNTTVDISVGSLFRNNGNSITDLHAVLVYDRILNPAEEFLLVKKLYNDRGYYLPWPDMVLTDGVGGSQMAILGGETTTRGDHLPDTTIDYPIDEGVGVPGDTAMHIQAVTTNSNGCGFPDGLGWVGISGTTGGSAIGARHTWALNYCVARRYEQSPAHPNVGSVGISTGPLEQQVFSRPFVLLGGRGTHVSGPSVAANGTEVLVDRVFPSFTCPQPGTMVLFVVCTLDVHDEIDGDILNQGYLSQHGSLKQKPGPYVNIPYGLFIYWKGCAKDEVLPAFTLRDTQYGFRCNSIFFYC